MSKICCQDFEPYVQDWSDQLLINYPPRLVFNIFASRDTLPAHSGCDRKYMKRNRLKAVKKPLDTGCCAIQAPPCCIDYSYSIIKPQFYGCHATLSMTETLQSAVPKVQGYVDGFTEQLRLTEDWLTGQTFKANASVYWARYGTSPDNPKEMTGKDFLMAANIPLDHEAMPVLKGQEGECKFDTSPINAGLVGIVHSHLRPDLYNLIPLFTPKYKYPQPNLALQSEEGAIGDVRILIARGENADDALITPESSELGNDVYDIPILGQDAFVIIDQEDLKPQISFRDAGGAHPLCMYVSWMMSYGTGIVNENFIVNMKVTRGAQTC